MNSVTARFNTTMVQMTKMSQWKKWLTYLSEKKQVEIYIGTAHLVWVWTSLQKMESIQLTKHLNFFHSINWLKIYLKWKAWRAWLQTMMVC